MARVRVVIEVPKYYELIVQTPDMDALEKWLKGDNEDMEGAEELLDDSFIQVETWDDINAFKVIEKRKLKPREQANGTRIRINKKGEMIS